MVFLVKDIILLLISINSQDLIIQLWGTLSKAIQNYTKIAICQMVSWFPPYHGRGKRHWTPFVI